MLYNATTGKRVKEPISRINWVHKLLKQDEFVLKQCLKSFEKWSSKANELSDIADFVVSDLLERNAT